MADRLYKSDFESINEAWYEGYQDKCKRHDESLQTAIQLTLELLHKNMLRQAKSTAKEGSTTTWVSFDYILGSCGWVADSKLAVYNWKELTDAPVVQNAIIVEFSTKWGVSNSQSVDGLSISYYSNRLFVTLRWPQSVARFKKRKLDEANEANKKANVQPDTKSDTKPTVKP